MKNTAASLLWAQENALDIQQKRVEYYLKWQAKPEMEKPRLNPTDGVVTTLNAQ
ncbi:hypothetical protein [Paucidesulfovibrio longus]|uniref:hypothetical protein n=1 Tax=Paucidesulfovibrio longus TaxID=889 RepID=UPI00040982BC|nr:hypothetical protein [Paucidesulfovibrio longus]